MVIDTEEEKENSSAKPFIYYTVASCSVYIPQIESYESNLLLKVPHPIQSDHYKRFIKSLGFFFFCFITQAPLRRILTIFSFGITVQHLQLRGIFGRKYIGQSKSLSVWPAQSQNNSREQQLDN